MQAAVKAHLTYEQQVDLLQGRGMVIDDRDEAIATLRRVNYYRLSGYWYPFREFLADGSRGDSFFPGTQFGDVVKLYDFDANLRAATFSVLTHVELAIRSHLGHALGRVDPCAHLMPGMLGPLARSGDTHETWLQKYQAAVADSHEDFVAHHQARYGGTLPIWAAVEVLDWGALTRLYGFSPRAVQNEVADACGLRAPQLLSWLKVLNLSRNTCAHHGRFFNRVYPISPKLPDVGVHPDLDSATTEWARTFARLTLVQFLLDRLDLGRMTLLPAVLKGFPSVKAVPITHVGAPSDWLSKSRLWGSSG